MEIGKGQKPSTGNCAYMGSKRLDETFAIELID